MDFRQGFARSRAAADVEAGNRFNRRGLQEEINEALMGNQLTVMGKRVVRQGLHQVCVWLFGHVWQQAGFQCGRHQGFQIAFGVGHIGVFGRNHFALLGDANLAGNRTCGLRQNRLVRRTTATTHTAATAVEQAHFDIVFGENFHQLRFGLVERPLAGDIAAVFVAVGITEHDFLAVFAAGEQGLVPVYAEQGVHHAYAVFQGFDGFKQRHDVDA